MSLPLGTVIAGKYRLHRKIGEGGMGAVYRAVNIQTETPLALKVLGDHLRANDGVALRFQQEARAAAKVRHPGIVRIFDTGQEQGRLWIAMELLQGETLADRLARAPLSGAELDAVFLPLLDILKHVHRAGIVHRDLKPQNVYLARHPLGGLQVRLLDFGIAKLSDARLGKHATHDGFALGTLHYMAPEQAMRPSSVDARADIWAFGAMLYECISGKLPYPAEAIGELISMHLAGGPKPLTVTPAKRPHARLAMACLTIHARDRPSSCQEVEQLWEQARVGPLKRSAAALPRAVRLGAGVLVLLGASAYGLSQREPALVVASSPGQAERAHVHPAVSPALAELDVRSDIAGAELVVNGNLMGSRSDQHWTLELAPGPYRLEARVADRVVAQVDVTASLRSPQSVILHAPLPSTNARRAASRTRVRSTPVSYTRARHELTTKEPSVDERTSFADDRATLSADEPGAQPAAPPSAPPRVWGRSSSSVQRTVWGRPAGEAAHSNHSVASPALD